MVSTRDVVHARTSNANSRATRRSSATPASVTTAPRGASIDGRATVTVNASGSVIKRHAKGRALGAQTLASGAPVKRRGRPPRGGRGGFPATQSAPTALSVDGTTATALHAAYFEMVMHQMMIYRARLAYDTMRRVAAEAQARAILSRGSDDKGRRTETDASQKQWPIVPQVSTAVCPPRRDSSRSTPGSFGKREAVNAGVQQASAAKTKARRKEAEGNTSANEASRSSHDDPKAATVKRMQEAKALLDPCVAFDRNALEHDTNRRGQRSGAPSPESSMQPPNDGADGLAGSVAHDSKGSEKESKSAALAR